MKTCTLSSICIALCLIPAVVAGQTQSPSNESSNSSQAKPSLLLNRQPAGVPILRLNSSTAPGEEGVKLDLTSLPLLDPGPAILLDCPDPMFPQIGSIRFQPVIGSSPLRITGSQTADEEIITLDLDDIIIAPYRPGIMLKKPRVPGIQSAIVMAPSENSARLIYTNTDPVPGNGLKLTTASPVLESFFDIIYDISTLSEERTAGDATSEMQLVTRYEKATPRLLESLTSTHALYADSFFDIIFDLSTSTETRTSGNTDSELELITIWDKATPKLSQRVETTLDGFADSFFDIAYNLNAGTGSGSVTVTHKDLLFSRLYSPGVPHFGEIRASTNPLYVDSFFDIAYDLSLGSERRRFGPEMSGLTLLYIYDKAIPKLLQRVSSPLIVDSFFDITYDLSLATESRVFGGDASGLRLLHVYDKATPKLLQRVSSPLIVDSFFDITYDLNSSRESHSSKAGLEDITMTLEYDKSTPKLLEKITSGNVGFTDSFFDITYDLSLGSSRHAFGDQGSFQVYVYDKALPKLLHIVGSNDPVFPDGIEVLFDLDAGDGNASVDESFKHLHFARLYGPGTPHYGNAVFSTDPLYTDSFFDITYDLSLAREAHRFGSPATGLVLFHEYEKATPKLLTRIVSGIPLYVDSFFDIVYDLSLGTESRQYGGDATGLRLLHIYNKALPKLLQRVESEITDSFFDITYDLSTSAETRTSGNNTSELQLVTIYDKATPKLLQRVSSTAVPDNFFDMELTITGPGTRKDVWYGLEVAEEFDSHADNMRLRRTIHSTDLGNNFNWDFLADLENSTYTTAHGSLKMVETFDKATPLLSKRIQSSEAAVVDDWFDVAYNIGTATQTQTFVDGVIEISQAKVFHSAIPKLSERITTTHALVPDSFFDIAYDLSTSTETRSSGNTISELQLVTIYDKATPKLTQRVTSSALPDNFFDISYSIDGPGVRRDVYFGLELAEEFDSHADNMKLTRTIHSVDLGNNENWNFITDLEAGTHATVRGDLQLVQTYDKASPLLAKRLQSTNPAFAGRYIEEQLDISTELLPLRLTSVGFPTADPLEMRYEYDGLDRKIREVTRDLGSGAILTIERQLQSAAGPPFMGQPVLFVQGHFSVSGAKLFKIDHPLDPDNKYLIHSCIESPDMMNVYNGNIVTDDKGYAHVELPQYFEALNDNFRYQLTCIGQFAQAIVAEEINNNQFAVMTDKPNVKVSWQVTGVRKDPAAKRDSYRVEVEKEESMKGKRLYQ